MLTKYAEMRVLQASRGTMRPSSQVTAGKRTAHRASFAYEPREGFIYVRSRAISSRCNDNFDEFPAEEIKQAYSSFVGKPVFVNHHNDDHRRARGVILDAVLHEDVNPDGSPDTWAEVLMEVDAVKFPKLAKAILAGHIDRTSMGTDVAYSICSVCANKAASPLQYCQHIPAMKGQTVWKTTASGSKEGVLVRELCYGLHFFENSLLVEDPADPTAFFLGVDDRGVGGGYEGDVKVTASARGSASGSGESDSKRSSLEVGNMGKRNRRRQREAALASRTASRKHAYGEAKAPQQVNTLRDEEDPDSVEPIPPFDDPDLDAAREMDLREELGEFDGDDEQVDEALLSEVSQVLNEVREMLAPDGVEEQVRDQLADIREMLEMSDGLEGNEEEDGEDGEFEGDESEDGEDDLPDFMTSGDESGDEEDEEEDESDEEDEEDEEEDEEDEGYKFGSPVSKATSPKEGMNRRRSLEERRMPQGRRRQAVGRRVHIEPRVAGRRPTARRKSAASNQHWYQQGYEVGFDIAQMGGLTSQDIEDAVMSGEVAGAGPLSGEFAGESIPEIFGSWEAATDEAMDSYEEGWWEGMSAGAAARQSSRRRPTARRAPVRKSKMGAEMKQYIFGDIIFDDSGETEKAIVYSVDDTQMFATDDEADDHMVANGYGGYLSPQTYRGRIMYENGNVASRRARRPTARRRPTRRNAMSAPLNRPSRKTAERYPDVYVQLSGEDGNAFGILGKVQKALKRAGASPEEVKEFMDEAMSGDYDHLLQTVMRWVKVGSRAASNRPKEHRSSHRKASMQWTQWQDVYAGKDNGDPIEGIDFVTSNPYYSVSGNIYWAGPPDGRSGDGFMYSVYLYEFDNEKDEVGAVLPSSMSILDAKIQAEKEITKMLSRYGLSATASRSTARRRPVRTTNRNAVRRTPARSQKMSATLKTLAEVKRLLQEVKKNQRAVQAQVNYIGKAAGIERQLKVVRKRADVENPAQPIPEPTPQATPYTTEYARDHTDADLLTPGGVAEVSDVSSDYDVDLLTPGGDYDVELTDGGDVTVPVAGTTEPNSYDEMVTRPEVQSRGLDTELAYEESQPLFGEEAKEARFVAALRLARLRLQAGIAKGDDLTLATSISQSKMKTSAIRQEIKTLDEVVKAGSKKPVSRTAARRLVPKAAGRTAPSMAAEAAVTSPTAPLGVSSEEFLWD